MDTIEDVTFRYDTVEVENGLKAFCLIARFNLFICSLLYEISHANVNRAFNQLRTNSHEIHATRAKILVFILKWADKCTIPS